VFCDSSGIVGCDSGTIEYKKFNIYVDFYFVTFFNLSLQISIWSKLKIQERVSTKNNFMKKILTFLTFVFVGILIVNAQQKNVSTFIENLKPSVSTNTSKQAPLYTITAPFTTLGVEYDETKNAFWVGCSTEGLHLIDTLTGALIYSEVTTNLLPDYEVDGLCLLPNGNLLGANYIGDGGNIISDYLFELDTVSNLMVNYLPLSGTQNTCTNSVNIFNVIDVSLGGNGNYFVTTYGGNYVFEISFTSGMPGTWTSVDTFSITGILTPCGIDYLDGYFVISDISTGNVVIVDDNFNVLNSFETVLSQNIGTTWIDLSTVAFASFSTIISVYESGLITFLNNPSDVVLCPFTDILLGVEALGATSYQWKESTDGGNTYTDLVDNDIFSNTTTDTLNITLAPASLAGNKYICVISNGTTEITSDTVTISLEEELPTIDCGENVEIDLLEGETFYTVLAGELDPIGADDNCGLETGYNDYNNEISLEGEEFPIGVIDVLWTVVDIAGNTASCTKTVTIYEYISVKENSNTFEIYPNPTSDFVYISSDIEMLSVKVMSITGEILFESNINNYNTSIDLFNLSNGMYLLNIQTNNEVKIEKIIIK